MNTGSELLNAVNIVHSVHIQRGETFHAWTLGVEIIFDRKLYSFLRLLLFYYWNDSTSLKFSKLNWLVEIVCKY